MRPNVLKTVVVGLLVVLAAIGGSFYLSNNSKAGDEQQERPGGLGIGDTHTASSSSAGKVEENEVQSVSAFVRNVYAKQFKTTPDNISILKIAAMTWPDTCMGFAGPGDVCEAKNVTGFVIRFQIKDQAPIYEVHVDKGLSNVGFGGALPHCADIPPSNDPTSCW